MDLLPEAGLLSYLDYFTGASSNWENVQQSFVQQSLQ